MKLAVLLIAIGSLRAQSPAGPKFEVASIKPSAGSDNVGIRIDGARVEIGHWSLKQLIMRAYGLEPYQVQGPDWMDLARFDVLAKLPTGAAEDQIPEMLKQLLYERFGLVAHSETRELPGFVLVTAKDGPKMKLAAPDPEEPVESAAQIRDKLSGSRAPYGLTVATSPSGDLHMEFTKMPMAALVQILGSYLRAPLIDMTGLEGQYQAILDFSLSTTLGAAASDPGDSSLFSTVNRLGLRLERRKGTATVVIVDHLEKLPTAN